MFVSEQLFFYLPSFIPSLKKQKKTIKIFCFLLTLSHLVFHIYSSPWRWSRTISFKPHQQPNELSLWPEAFVHYINQMSSRNRHRGTGNAQWILNAWLKWFGCIACRCQVFNKELHCSGPSPPPPLLLPALLQEGRRKGETAIPAGLGTLFESGKPQLISKEEA